MKTTFSQTLYYGLRVLQRILLLLAGLLTVIYWAVLLNIYIGGVFAREQVGHQWHNASGLDGAIQTSINVLTWKAITASLVAIVLTMALLCVPRVRRGEKRLVADGVVVALFCIVSVLLSQILLKSFIRHYLEQYNIAL